MKKLALFAILGLFVAAFAFAQSEETTTATQQPSTSEKTIVTKDGEIIGTIEKVDVPTKTFVVKVDKDGTMTTKTYTFNEQTTFGTPEKVLKVEELKTGDVIVLQSDPKNVVTSVRIKEIEPEK
jgi:hypothetical protein